METNKDLEHLQTKFQTELEKLTKAQKKADKLVRLNSQLETQLHENEMVKEELALCGEDAKVFKLVGDVLLPQSLQEAQQNVHRRIEYIQNESKRNNEVITESRIELQKMKEGVQGIEIQMQKVKAGIPIKK